MIPISSLIAINALFAAAGAVLLFRSINRMNGITDHAMRYALVLMCAGLIGEACATWLTDAWQEGIDTLLFGGLFAAFLGTRRETSAMWISETWRERMSIGTSIVTFAMFLASVA